MKNEPESAGPDVEAEHRFRIKDAIGFLRSEKPNDPKIVITNADSLDVDQETVAWMLHSADQKLSFQILKIESLRTRAQQLAGFSGILLGLLATQVPGGLSGSTGAGWWFLLITLAVALASLLGAILISMLYVASPTRLRELRESELIKRSLLDPDSLTEEPWHQQLKRLETMPSVLNWNQWLGNKRASALSIAYVLLAVGLISAAICVAALSVKSEPEYVTVDQAQKLMNSE